MKRLFLFSLFISNAIIAQITDTGNNVGIATTTSGSRLTVAENVHT
ncbi:hypothetical protein [Flavivirga jejuensis]|uniref:Uncharacterized protein n=1 Tax=Flavivirga jejuensis TaxID=870487 RepID=A0ABT8WMY8_9FLAO|nr:hypothetical protein [Flavivirga jejuensis]MDO5974511.1 hypothetical protein [Flavivirga jejuensis]